MVSAQLQAVPIVIPIPGAAVPAVLGICVAIVVLGWLANLVNAPKRRQEREAALAERQQQPYGGPQATAQAGQWAPDPWQRYEFRYFDGQRWTEHVAANGWTGTDAPQ